MKTVTIEFKKDYLEFKKGDKKTIFCDADRTPLEKRFRDILNDSEIDGTASIIKSKINKAKVETLSNVTTS